jgi:2'-5' RNA ligase
MKRRVFISIPLPRVIRENIEVWQIRHPDFNVRWIKPENLHITVVPPWYVEEAELYHVENALQRAVKGFRPFSVHFQRIIWGPPGREARLIWAEGETTEEFQSLKNLIEDELLSDPETEFIVKENRPSKLHITIARFPPASIKKLSKLDETAGWSFEVNEVALMESVLKMEGAEYGVIKIFNFQ